MHEDEYEDEEGVKGARGARGRRLVRRRGGGAGGRSLVEGDLRFERGHVEAVVVGGVGHLGEVGPVHEAEARAEESLEVDTTTGDGGREEAAADVVLPGAELGRVEGEHEGHLGDHASGLVVAVVALDGDGDAALGVFRLGDGVEDAVDAIGDEVLERRPVAGGVVLALGLELLLLGLGARLGGLGGVGLLLGLGDEMGGEVESPGVPLAHVGSADEAIVEVV
mmetsp:Transcript_5120/g.15512  ORF Transcript_5120/g.15512 Transcript_5120/m.15512 type:complete len:223 (-) Transcript_5120:1151-1819(-)